GGGGKQRVGRGEGSRWQWSLVPRQSLNWSALSAPKANRPIFAGRSDLAPIRRKGRVVNASAIFVELPVVVIGQVPEAHRRIIAEGQKAVTVRRKHRDTGPFVLG